MCDFLTGTACVLQLPSYGTRNLYRSHLCEGKEETSLYYSQEQTFMDDRSLISPE